jgi:hypothetical protein
MRKGKKMKKKCSKWLHKIKKYFQEEDQINDEIKPSGRTIDTSGTFNTISRGSLGNSKKL